MDLDRCPQTGTEMTEAGIIGTDIDRYRVLRWLGAGGFGQVYKAEHRVMNRLAALKILRPEQVSNTSVHRFFAEARAAAVIGNPHIVQVYDAGTDSRGLNYLAMEYIDGCTLTSFLRKSGPISLERAAGIIAQLLSALSAAHQVGIVHRDIKPSNVMMEGLEAGNLTGRERLVRLVDFGISKVPTQRLSTVTKMGTALGTIGYAAPEQFRSAAGVDARADLYSVGALLFIMLTGELTHAAKTHEEMVLAVCTEKPRKITSLRSDLPPGMEDFIQQSIATHPTERFDSADAMLLALRRIDPDASGTVHGKAGDRRRVSGVLGSKLARRPALWAALGATVAGSAIAVAIPTTLSRGNTASQAQPETDLPKPAMPATKTPVTEPSNGAHASVALPNQVARPETPEPLSETPEVFPEAPELEPATSPSEPRAGRRKPAGRHPRGDEARTAAKKPTATQSLGLMPFDS